jgi:hypothetical protein
MAARGGPSGVVGRLMDGGDSCGNKNGGIKEEKERKEKARFFLILPQELSVAPPLGSFSCAFGR